MKVRRSLGFVVTVVAAGFIGLPATEAAEVELTLGTTTRVSVRSDGAEVRGADSWGGPISDDGRLVAFTTEARLHHADQDRSADVYVHDLVSGTTRVVSVRDDEAQIEPDASLVGMTADARLVFFLLPTTGFESHRILVRDRVTGTTSPLVAGVDDATVSSDGVWVAYTERTFDEEGMPERTRLELLQVATRTSVPVFRTRRNLWEYSVADTGDVAFDTDAVVVPGGGGGDYEMDVFVWHRADGSRDLLSGDLPGFQNQTPVITRDGNAVAFWTDRGQMDDSGYAVWERASGATQQVVRVSTESEFIGNVGVLTPDGSHLAYVGEGHEGGYETPVMVLDRTSGVIERIDVSDAGRGSSSDSRSGVWSITPDGRYVSFFSLSDELVAADMNTSFDVFVRDRLGAPPGIGVPDLRTRTRGEDRVTGAGDIDPVGWITHQVWDVRPGDVVTVSLAVRNLGNAQDRFVLEGAGSVRWARVSYWVGDERVSDLVRDGTYRTPMLAPSTRQAVRMHIAVDRDAPACRDRSFPLRASASSSAWTDAMRVQIEVACG